MKMESTAEIHVKNDEVSIQEVLQMPLKKILFVCMLGLSMIEMAYAAPPQKGCKYLKPVKYLNDLMEQLYANLNSNCILEMSAEELTEKWEVPVFNIEDTDEIKLSQWNKMRFRPYTGGSSGLIILKVSPGWAGSKNNSLQISGTRDYRHRYSSLFLDGKLPTSIPKPVGISGETYVHFEKVEYTNFLGAGQPNDFLNVNVLYWELPQAKKKKLPRIHMDVETDGVVNLIIYECCEREAWYDAIQ